MAIDLNADIKAAVDGALEARVPCLLGTASDGGEPDIAIRGSMMVYDNEHLAYWERSLNESLANLEKNPHVVVFFRNPETRAQYRFYGEATIYKQGDEMRDKIMGGIIQRELDADPERKGFGVLIRVDRVRQGNNVVQTRE